MTDDYQPYLDAITEAATNLAAALTGAVDAGLPQIVILPHLLGVVRDSGLLDGVDLGSMPMLG